MKRVEMIDIRKSYGSSGTRANDGACLELEAGSIHALVGENGAGKTTLMRILSGLERPDSGRILFDGVEADLGSPAAAARLGVGMVHQHFTIIPGFSAAENIVFGAEPLRAGIFLDRRAALRAAAAAAGRYGFTVDPAKSATQLSAGERQQVEILRLLHRNRELLILDEPTSVLTEQETKSFFGVLRSLAALGKTIVLISHKIREVLEVSDQVTVMRAGRTLGDYPREELDEARLSSLVMGGAARRRRDKAPPRPPREPVLRFDSIRVAGRHRAPPLLAGLSFSVFPGRILGLCALAGNGLKEVEELLAGRLKPSAGEILLRGGSYPALRKAPWTPGGIAYVPSDRVGRGSCAGASLWENFAALDRDRFFPRGLVDAEAARKAATEAMAHYALSHSPDRRAGELSGGNLQRMILARELSEPRADLVVLCDPSWGLDMASADRLYDRIEVLKEEGSAILLLSSNLDEILDLSDDVIVLHAGKAQARLSSPAGLSKETMGSLMLGLDARTGVLGRGP